LNRWEWEGMGMLKAIPAHLYPSAEEYPRPDSVLDWQYRPPTWVKQAIIALHQKEKLWGHQY